MQCLPIHDIALPCFYYKTRGALSRAQVSLSGNVDHKAGSAPYVWLANSLSQCTSVVKFSWKYDQQFSSGWVRQCWCLAEVCTLQMISKILWGFLNSGSKSGKNFMKIRSLVIKILGEFIIPLSVGGGLHSTNDFQSVKETSPWQDRSLIKFSWRYDQELSSC